MGSRAGPICLAEGQMGQTIYKLIFCGFVALGCMVQLGPILDISDALVFLICVPNILGLYFLAPIVRREMKSYMARLASGENQEIHPLNAQSQKQSAPLNWGAFFSSRL